MRLPSIVRLSPLVLLLAPATAAAQQSQPSPDPLDAATLRVGPFGLTPTIAIRDIGRDTNVFNEATNPKSDFTATISPKLGVLVHPGPVLFTYTTTTDYVYYQTYASERGTNVGSSLRVDFDFGAFKPFVSAAAGNTRERVNREIDARARHRDQAYAAGLRLQLSEAVFATVGARQTKTDYDSNAEFRGQRLETTLNQTLDAVDAGGGVALTPLTTVQLVVTKERSRFEFTPERNSESLRLLPSVSFSPLAALNGTASVGYRRFTAHSALVPDFSGLISTVTLATTAVEGHRVEATFSRDLSYSYEEDTSEYIETGVQLAWTWQIAGPFDSRLTAGRSRLHYRGPDLAAGRDDDTATNYGISLGWHAKEQLRIAVNADWRARDSERSADRAYDNRRIYANLTWGRQ
jgi:hypothetical protein